MACTNNQGLMVHHKLAVQRLRKHTKEMSKGWHQADPAALLAPSRCCCWLGSLQGANGWTIALSHSS